jgi:hypothetical protein
MKNALELKLEELKKKAQAESGKTLLPSKRHRSSLHKIIKTKQQANALMKSLQAG